MTCEVEEESTCLHETNAFLQTRGAPEAVASRQQSNWTMAVARGAASALILLAATTAVVATNTRMPAASVQAAFGTPAAIAKLLGQQEPAPLRQASVVVWHPTMPNSCALYGCGKTDSRHKCQCVESCLTTHNCCSDYKSMCTGEDQIMDGHSSGSGSSSSSTTKPSTTPSTTPSTVRSPQSDPGALLAPATPAPAPPVLSSPATAPGAWKPETPAGGWQPQAPSQGPLETTSKRAGTRESNAGPNDGTTTEAAASGIHSIISGAKEKARHVQQKAKEAKKHAMDFWSFVVHTNHMLMNSTGRVMRVLAKVVKHSQPVLQALQRFGAYALDLARRGTNATAEGLVRVGALGVVSWSSGGSSSAPPPPTTKSPGGWVPAMPGGNQGSAASSQQPPSTSRERIMQPTLPATTTTLPSTTTTTYVAPLTARPTTARPMPLPDSQAPSVMAPPTRRPGPSPITTSVRGMQGQETTPPRPTIAKLPPEWNIW